ncbi:type II CAAX endopeptidase family protein [uncultured Microbacterium sp.]|uniref:CPBP family intramembrane glutamic endopeptidase n=1 Tax=uncultured Microbacterium sp. TaxID=191216 RepID=UPI0025EB8101|nr:type II CAAX endopeptidase family protein [uncultured Microbacterium sp.]
MTGWNAEMLGWAVCALGLGVIGAHLVGLALPEDAAGDAAQALVWLCFAVPIAAALRRSRPLGLFRLRAVDVAYGIVFGALVRGAQGVIGGLSGTPAPWPSTFSTDGALPSSFLTQAVTGTLVAPVLEEGFFRGVVLVCAFVLLRRSAGSRAAGIASVALSTTLFVLAHQLLGSPDAVDLATLALLGVTTGVFVLATGRLWPAVLVHVFFNATGFAMLAVGTLLA